MLRVQLLLAGETLLVPFSQILDERERDGKGETRSDLIELVVRKQATLTVEIQLVVHSLETDTQQCSRARLIVSGLL